MKKRNSYTELKTMRLLPDSKHSQITIIIIIAIIIVAIIFSFIYFNKSSAQENQGAEYFKSQGLQPSINNIQDFIIDCLETTSKDALIKIGLQGGYYNPPELYFDMEWNFIPYYYHQGQLLMPSKSKIESELSSFVNEKLDFCLSDIDFKGFQLSYSEPQTQTTINQKTITFKTKLPVIIKHGENTVTFELSQHQVTIDSKLKEILEVADYITSSHQQDNQLICINCLVEMTKQKDLYVDFISFSEDSTLVMLIENKTMSEPYIFEFLNKYTIEEIGE
jgi:hypothetical protein